MASPALHNSVSLDYIEPHLAAKISGFPGQNTMGKIHSKFHTTMDAQLEQVISSLECNIDFKGQELVKQIYTKLSIFGAVISVIFGFLLQDVHYTAYAYLAFCILTLLITLPAWPNYNENATKWLPRPKVTIDFDNE